MSEFQKQLAALRKARADNTTDTIKRQDAIDALWKALYEYEDKTEKQFQESDELDIGDWIQHRIFVQNMSDIDRQTILELPSAEHHKLNIAEYIHDQYPDVWKHAEKELEVPSAERKGKWKEVYAETDYRNGWIEFSCECCEYQHGLESGEYGWYYGDEIPWKYCPMCGARMVSEDGES